MENRRGAYRVLVGKRESKKKFGRPRRRWKDKEFSRNRMRGLHWIDLAQDKGSWQALVSEAIASRSIKRGEFLNCLWNY